MSAVPYYTRWIKFAQTLEDARRQAIALGSVMNVNPNVDPSIERFDGREVENFDELIADVRRALDFDEELLRGQRATRFDYRDGDLYSDARRSGGKGRVRRGGKGRAPGAAGTAAGGWRHAALARLERAIRAAKGGYSPEVHEAQDACYDDARIDANEVGAFEDEVRRKLLRSKDPETRSRAQRHLDWTAAMMSAVNESRAVNRGGGKARAVNLADAVRKLTR